MKNLYLASKHPAFCFSERRGGGFECKCGHWSMTKVDHNNHVLKDHEDPELWKRMLSDNDYERLAKPCIAAMGRKLL